MAPERRLSLAEFAGKLVALELAIHDGAADAAWIAPRILLPKVAVSPKTRPIHNTILLVADALRADKLPMFANSRVRAPNIAKTAEAMGISFTTTQAASPSSPPSHATIQSGCMPRKSGILGDKSKLNPGTPMVSALLAKAGVATDFVGDASFAMKRLLPASTWNEFHQPNAEGKGGDCSAVIKQILAFADKQGDKRFFVSAVAFEAHTPYIYHEGTTEHYYSGPLDPAIGKSPDGVILTAIVGRKLTMTPERWGQLKGLYDGEVEHLDGCFGALTEGLQSRGLADSTDIILLADHGEGFLEHGSMGHAYGQYAELTHVPLTFFLPGVGHGQKIDTVVGHIDVVPTILDRMGIGADPRLQGESLLPMMSRQGPWMPRVMPSEYGRSYSLRARDLHYVVDYGGNESLFAVATDPDEKTDVKDRRPLALRYFRDLAGIYLAHRAQWSTAAWGTLNNHRAGFAAATQGATAP
jgi:arylsulfatase A-like enzyme